MHAYGPTHTQSRDAAHSAGFLARGYNHRMRRWERYTTDRSSAPADRIKTTGDRTRGPRQRHHRSQGSWASDGAKAATTVAGDCAWRVCPVQ